MRFLKHLIIILVIVVVGLVAYAYSGYYDVAVGSGHNPVTAWYFNTVRERSIESSAAGLSVPEDLGEADRIAAGGRYYKRGCAGCHGRPGHEPTESFEPRPPALARIAADPREAFWAIRNGIKMSAMPRHAGESDREIWNIVAFLQRLPELDAEQYAILTSESDAPAPPEADAGESAEGESADGEGADSEAGSEQSQSADTGAGAPESEGAAPEAEGDGSAQAAGEQAQESAEEADEGDGSQSPAAGSSESAPAGEGAAGAAGENSEALSP